MKLKTESTEPEFKPVKLTITFETRDEILAVRRGCTLVTESTTFAPYRGANEALGRHLDAILREHA